MPEETKQRTQYRKPKGLPVQMPEETKQVLVIF
jgi:hypothetical protein